MKKRLLAILMATAMSMALIACGGGEEETVTKDAPTEDVAENDTEADTEEAEAPAGDYTEEQVAALEAYQKMLDDYNAAVDAANAVPQITENQELVDVMNQAAATIDEITTLMDDAANLNDQFFTDLDVFVGQTYVLINRLQELSELLPILTIAGYGEDEAANQYYFAMNEEETVGAMVILSADQTQNVYCAGEMVVSEDGTYTISNGEYEMSMLVEVIEEGLAITMQDGTIVGMVGADPFDVVDAMLAIQEATENVNE